MKTCNLTKWATRTPLIHVINEGDFSASEVYAVPVPHVAPVVFLFYNPNAGAVPEGEGAHPARAPSKIGKNMIFWRKSWFFTRNTQTIFALPSAQRNFFKCDPLPPNLKSWIRPCNDKSRMRKGPDCYKGTYPWLLSHKYSVAVNQVKFSK